MTTIFTILYILLLVATPEVMSKTDWTFGHVSFAILGGAIFGFIGFLHVAPRSGYFSTLNKIYDPLKTSHISVKYSDPLVDKTCYSRAEYISALEELAQKSQSNIDIYEKLLKNAPNNISEDILKELMQRQALAEKYKKEKEERSFFNLYVRPLFFSIMGINLGLLLNELVFNVQNLFINIIITVIGIFILLLYLFFATTYQTHTL